MIILQYYKLIIMAILSVCIGFLYVSNQHLKTELATQQVEIVQYEADIGKLVKEIEFRQVDKDSLESGIKALQESLESTQRECERNLASTEKRYKTLLNRKFTESTKVISKGAIDEKTSEDYIEYLNSTAFSN